MIRAAVLTLVLALVPAASASARPEPPICPDAYLLTPVDRPLNLPAPRCSGAENVTIVELVAGSGPAHGTINSGVYVPAPGYHGVDEFRYTVTDAANGKSNEFTINVLVDTPPECRDTTATVITDRALVLPELDCSDRDGDEFTIYFDDAANGTLTLSGGDLIYKPNPGYLGPDTFTYYAREDEYGVASDDAWMTLAVNPAPVIRVPIPIRTPVPAPVPVAPPDTVAPVVKLKNASKKQAVSIVLTTSENASATLALALDKATAKKLKLGRTVGTLKAALTPGSETIDIKLSAKARRVFKKLKRVKLTLTAVVTDTAGNKTTKTLAVTLKK